AITSGPWSDASTWASGQIPDTGARVLVPDSVMVTLDVAASDRLDWLRIDGHLRFATDAVTRLEVETIVVTPGGKLEIGSADAPISPGASATVLFTDPGAIDTAWDPTLISRGLISHGEVRIHGAAKAGPIELTVAPVAGATTLELAELATGWAVGDRVLVPGVVRPLENNAGTTLIDEDELVTITAVSEDGRTITFAEPLAFDHVPPDARLTLPVANLDRNIVFESENKVDPSRAGHVMLMHTPSASIDFAAFRHIGRNDKSVPTTDPQLDDSGALIPGTGDNPRGRYALHFHRMGTEGVAATVTGSVVEHSPGWGFVNHDSHVMFRENVSYDVKGAGFVTEIGNERGAFIDNFAARSRGKAFYQPLAGSDKDEGNGFGSTGHGFWLQSATVALVGNVASGHAQEGIFINNRTVTEPGRDLPTYASLVDTPIGTPLDYSPGGREPQVRDDLIRPDQAPLAEVSGNRVFASGAGMAIRWRRQETAVSEGDEGDVIRNFQIWNVEWAGIHMGYVSGLTFRDGLILGDLDDPIRLGVEESADRSVANDEFAESVGKGIFANRNSRNLTFENLEVGGFEVGIQALTHGHTRIDSVRLQNVENLVVVTPQATSLSNDSRRVDATDVTNIPLSTEALDGRTPLSVRLQKQLVRAPVAGGSTPEDEFDAFAADDQVYYNGHRLFFHDQAADAVPFPSASVPTFMGGAPYDAYVDRTNEDLTAEFGVALGGAVAPPAAFDAVESLGVSGLAVQLTEAPAPVEQVEFRFAAPVLTPIWFLGDATATLEWQSKSVPLDAQWRVYLSGEDGAFEVGRWRWPALRGRISPGEAVEGWQSWRFDFQGDGNHNGPGGADLTRGDYVLLASVDDGPAVYLGRVILLDKPFIGFGFGGTPTETPDPQPVARAARAAFASSHRTSIALLSTIDQAHASSDDDFDTTDDDSATDPVDPVKARERGFRSFRASIRLSR
ncbi:MAG: G8 domain-containing protein, partial [Planctomycetota bacterium]